MKNWSPITLLFSIALFTMTLESCGEKKQNANIDIAQSTVASPKPMAKQPLSEEFKKYWYAGNAEITSYALKQARYGEIREGKSVLIYVTEPFLADKQVKADESNPDNIQVLKLNSTKKYLTGIYPYSIMSSSFYPVHNNQHALKVSFSAQEWCGQVYAQLNNRGNFQVTSHSYFESEADQDIELDKTTLENELWNQLRIDPENLPLGEIKIIPSLEYTRLSHKSLKSYDAVTTLSESDGIKTYKISYPELNRTLEINFSSNFPYTIEGWSESFQSGYGSNAKLLTTEATKIKTLKTPYWRQNSNSFLPMRDSLGL